MKNESKELSIKEKTNLWKTKGGFGFSKKVEKLINKIKKEINS